MTPPAAVRLGRRVFGAGTPLADPAFRRMCVAHGVNVLGYWIYLTAVFTTMSVEFKAGPGQIATFTALSTLPLILLAPFTGLVVDRLGAHGALRVAYVGAAAVMLGATQVETLGHFYLCALGVAVVVSLLRPAVFGLLARLVPDDALGPANGALAAAGEAGIVIGPLIAALSIRVVGTRPSFFLAALALVSAALLISRVPAPVVLDTTPIVGWRARVRELAAGLRMLARDKPSLVSLVCIVALFGFIGALFSVEPVLLERELGVGQGSLGLVYAAAGTGSCLSALALSRRPMPLRPLPRIGIALALLGVSTVGYSTSPNLLGAAAWSFVVGSCFGWVLAPSVTIVQRRAPSVVIGRVMAVVAIAQQASQGGAALLVGGLSGQSVRPPMAFTGLALVVIGGVVWLGCRRWVEPPPLAGSPAAGGLLGDDGVGLVDPDRAAEQRVDPESTVPA